jgi:6-pyruvoyl-tetrahydropterin synthase
MILTWADAHFCAAHRSDDGRLHGHTWRVRGYWIAGRDASEHARTLGWVLRAFDHGELPAELRWAEDIASYVGERARCERVDVWREVEGFGATWTR